jgi:hypothetical protein
MLPSRLFFCVLLFTTSLLAQSRPFLPPVDYAAGLMPAFVAIGDVNNDGKLDLVTANEGSFGGGGVSVLLGKGDGTFNAALNYPMGYELRSVALADFNGDGKLDLAATNFNARGRGELLVALGNGDGSFQSANVYATGPTPLSLAVGDFNHDHIPDVVVTADTFEPGYVVVFVGNGDGTFQRPTKYVATRSFPVFVSVSDFNEDGNQDLAVASEGGSVSILLGNADGTFQHQLHFFGGSILLSLAVADVNGDGHQDIVSADTPDAAVQVLVGGGNASFQFAKQFAVSADPASVVVADFNNDGKPDIVTANPSSQNLTLLYGNGDGTFQAPRLFGSGPSLSAATADLNGDGWPDLVIAQGSANKVSVLLNAGGASHSSTTSSSCSIRATARSCMVVGSVAAIP